MNGFGEAYHDLGICQLRCPKKEEVEFLAAELVKIDPWKTLKTSSEVLINHFLKQETGGFKSTVIVDNKPVGLISIKSPWLLGPYLEFLGLIPVVQGKGVGKALMLWLEKTTRLSKDKNIFICVSDFNNDAYEFYKQFGYIKCGHLDDLSIEGKAEFLLRKRLS